MATKRTFRVTGTSTINGNMSVTITNPKNGITTAEVTNFIDKYDELYGDSTTLKQAYYIDTSETTVYPAA